ncbi:DUF4351 domain-containing protein [Clostridium estertheticum]|nr:DUF4351 domain-containing protein [Clostridium estertheticum]MBU3185204.1 DUF4351 domain-containing protein [Clostridium estertheticum]
MKHDGETEKEHILECLSVVEKIEDTDYYFLTVECLKKIYQTSEYEEFVEEEIYMSSALYKEPYEKGREEGLQEGETKTLARTTIKFLIKKFGIIPDDLKESIQKLDATTLEIIIDNILEYESLDQIKKYIR